MTAVAQKRRKLDQFDRLEGLLAAIFESNKHQKIFCSIHRLHEIFYNLAKAPEGKAILKDYRFAVHGDHHYSKVLHDHIVTLEFSGLLSASNPDLKYYVPQPDLFVSWKETKKSLGEKEVSKYTEAGKKFAELAKSYQM